MIIINYKIKFIIFKFQKKFPCFNKMNSSLGQGVQGLPQVSHTKSNVLGQNVQGTPNITEDFGGGSGLVGYDLLSLDYLSRFPYGYNYVYPTYVQKNIQTCGGENCNQYWNESNKRYESSPGSQCTCCSSGKTCRIQNSSPNGTVYSDCCLGMVCKGEGVQGICMNK
jgi:hypothetical protein